MTQDISRRTATALTAAAVAGPAVAAARYWPTGNDWAGVDPGTAGFDPARLAAALDDAMARKSTGLLVLRGGRIVAERYAEGWDKDRSREVASTAKSITSVLVGMAIDDGKIQGLDQGAADFIPKWKGTPKAAITIRHLLSMTSGLDDAGLKPRNVAGDQFAINAAAPLKHPPGTHWHYNTPAYHLLFHVVARATGGTFEAYARRKLLDPIGMSGTTWLTSTGEGASGPVTNYYTSLCTARDLGRLGLFAQRGGVWAEKRLVTEDYLRASLTASQPFNRSYGLLWWVNREPGVWWLNQTHGVDPATLTPRLRFPGSPPDTFAAMGAGLQLCMVAPSLDLVVVRQGDNPGSEALASELLAGVVGAVTG